MNFEKYMHLERLGNDEVEGITEGIVYAFPKLDGTNGQLWWDEEKGLQAGSRNRVLSLESDNAGFMAHAVADKRYTTFFRDFPHLRLIGEWLVPHSLKTYRDDAWRKFYIFDVQHESGGYYTYDQYKILLSSYNLDYLAPLAILKNPSYEQLQGVLERNVFLIKDGEGVGEGIVLKNYNWSNRFGRVVWAKMITNAFKEVHHKEMGAPIINGDLVEEKIVNEFVNQHLVDKVVAKITLQHDGWNSKYIGQLLGVVWYDLITEEAWNFMKKFNNPRVDFKLLQRLTIAKVKEIRSDLF